ncbi:MAG: hypothetical protein JW990_13170, partial [Thermoleophilia bacterium]|nr:hypothetical protein [Thermoleophilia bacterium]
MTEQYAKASTQDVPSRPAVSAVRCSEYEIEAVRAALERLLDPLGGMAAFVRPGERIALKPNVLMPT